MRSNRNRADNPTVAQDVDTALQPETTDTPAETTPEIAPDVQVATANRSRKPVDVGEIKLAPSTKTKLTTRPTTVDSNPVFQAVKTAAANRENAPGALYDIVAADDKVDGVISSLRRAGQRYGVGVNIDSDRVKNDDGTTTLTFGVSERRQRKSKTADATETPAESVPETA